MFKCDLCEKEFDSLKGFSNHNRFCWKTIHLKNKVIEMYKNNYSILEINKELKLNKNKISEYDGVSGNSIKKWKKYYESYGFESR